MIIPMALHYHSALFGFWRIILDRGFGFLIAPKPEETNFRYPLAIFNKQLLLIYHKEGWSRK
jgi:hypothetical protein